MNFFILMLAILLSGFGFSKSIKVSGIENSINSEISKLVLQKAYAKLGIELIYIPLPGQRALVESNSGKVDGELFRIDHVDKKFTNLVKVPTSINKLEAMAFSTNKSLVVSGWESLRGKRIGIQVGIKFAERGTQGMNPVAVETNGQLMQMLTGDRIDLAVIARVNGLHTIKKMDLQDKVFELQPTMQSYPLYHYLHKKNRDLVKRLDEVLKSMAFNGTISSIREEYIKTNMMGQKDND